MNISIKCAETKEVLFQCDSTEKEKLYQYAVELEKLDIPFIIDDPPIIEELAIELGASKEEQEILRESAILEIEEHSASEEVKNRA